MRTICAAAVLAGMALLGGCMRPTPPLDPAEAPAKAAEALQAILDRGPSPAAPSPPRALAGESRVVRVWYPDHPLMRRLASPQVRAEFAAAHPGVTLEAQGIGDWMYAVQKLAVHLAGGGLPDIAIVRRDLLAQLVPSGRILPLDALLSTDLSDDLEPPIRRAFSADGNFYALPADAFHSVVYFAGTAPAATVFDLAQPVDGGPAGAAHVPFLETLWANGGAVLDGRAVAIDSQDAQQAFRLAHALYNPGQGAASLHALFDETHGLALFVSGRAARTVASSRNYARVLEQRPEAQVQAIPGAAGAVSRWGDHAIVVFADTEASAEALGAVLDFLTGSAIQGAEALQSGSPPVRRSVREALGVDHPLMATWSASRAAPLVPEWGELENALHDVVERVSRFEGPPLAVASGSG